MNKKIIYFFAKSHNLHRKGAAAVQFLIQPFHIFGIEGQNWMLIVLVLIIAFAFLIWRTRDNT